MTKPGFLDVLIVFVVCIENIKLHILALLSPTLSTLLSSRNIKLLSCLGVSLPPPFLPTTSVRTAFYDTLTPPVWQGVQSCKINTENVL